MCVFLLVIVFSCDRNGTSDNTPTDPVVEQPSGLFEEWAGYEPQYYVTNLAIHGVIKEHDLNTGVVKVVKDKWDQFSESEKDKAIQAIQAEQDNNVTGISVTIILE